MKTNQKAYSSPATGSLPAKKTNEDFNNRQPKSSDPDLGKNATKNTLKNARNLADQTDDEIKQHINAVSDNKIKYKREKVNGLKW